MRGLDKSKPPRPIGPCHPEELIGGSSVNAWIGTSVTPEEYQEYWTILKESVREDMVAFQRELTIREKIDIALEIPLPRGMENDLHLYTTSGGYYEHRHPGIQMTADILDGGGIMHGRMFNAIQGLQRRLPERVEEILPFFYEISEYCAVSEINFSFELCAQYATLAMLDRASNHFLRGDHEGVKEVMKLAQTLAKHSGTEITQEDLMDIGTYVRDANAVTVG